MSAQSESQRVVACLVLTALFVSGAIAPVSAAVGHPETDNTVTRIDVRGDASARWTVQIRTRLDTDESVRHYERFQRRFRSNESALFAPFEDRIRRIVARAENATGRSMAARNFSAATSVQAVPRRWGVVTFAFTWDGFARRSGDALVVGDAFESGFFIAENDTAKVSAPAGYGIESHAPTADAVENGTAVWHGRRDFAADRPHVRFVPAEAGTAGGVTIGGYGLVPIAGGIALLTLLGGGAYVATRRGRDGEEVTEPVTDRERIRRLLAHNGGRMKQRDVVESVDWSKSKVSRVVGKLADDGVVEKTRIGRENVIELRDAER